MSADSIHLVAEVFRDAEQFSAHFLRIRNKRMQLCNFNWNAAQRDLWERMTHRNLILKSRQLGFSTWVQALLYHANVTGTSATLTLSDVDQNTKKLRAIFNRFHDKWPTEPAEAMTFRAPRDRDSEILITYPLTDSSSEIVTAGGKTAGRSGTYSHLHGSEVAFWRDAESIFAGALQATTPDSTIWLESTPNGAQGKFYELCQQALDGDPEWSLHFYPWWWADEYRLPLDEGEQIILTDEEGHLCDRLLQEGINLQPEQIKWRRAKQHELPHTFLQEYPEDPRSCFLLSGSGFFGDMTGLFSAPTNTEPSDHRYVAGLDFGQATDYTVLSIGDADTNQQVATLRINKLPWEVIRSHVLDLCNRWQVSLLVVEINAAGAPNFEALAAAPNAVPMMPYTTTAANKRALIQSLYSGLHNSGLRLLPLTEQRREFAAFKAIQNPMTGAWSYAAEQGEHDDYVMAAALMWHGIEGDTFTMGWA